MEDFKKTINYLSQAIASLSCVFDLAVPESNSKKSRHKDPNSSLPSNFPETVPDQASHYIHIPWKTEILSIVDKFSPISSWVTFKRDVVKIEIPSLGN